MSDAMMVFKRAIRKEQPWCIISYRVAAGLEYDNNTEVCHSLLVWEVADWRGTGSRQLQFERAEFSQIKLEYALELKWREGSSKIYAPRSDGWSYERIMEALPDGLPDGEPWNNPLPQEAWPTLTWLWWQFRQRSKDLEDRIRELARERLTTQDADNRRAATAEWTEAREQLRHLSAQCMEEFGIVKLLPYDGSKRAASEEQPEEKKNPSRSKLGDKDLDRLRVMYENPRTTWDEILSEFPNLSKDYIGNKMREMGVKAPAARKAANVSAARRRYIESGVDLSRTWSPDRVEKIKRIYAEGKLTRQEAAQELGVTLEQLECRARMLRLHAPAAWRKKREVNDGSKEAQLD